MENITFLPAAITPSLRDRAFGMSTPSAAEMRLSSGWAFGSDVLTVDGRGSYAVAGHPAARDCVAKASTVTAGTNHLINVTTNGTAPANATQGSPPRGPR